MTEISICKEKGISAAEARQAKKEYWFGVVRSWRQSGLSQEGYCKKEGLCYSRFKYWNTQVKAQDQGLVTGGGFIQAVVREDEPATEVSRDYDRDFPEPVGVTGPRSGLELYFTGGEHVVLHSGFDEVSLRRLVEVMRSRHV
jgi:hypothetical protein